MLDSRLPPGDRYQEQEALAERQIEEETRRLLAETKLWRLANSAMWVAWGIVQAHVPGLPDFDAEEKKKAAAEAAAAAHQHPDSQAAAELESTTAEIRAAAEAGKQQDGIVSTEKAEQNGSGMAGEQDADLFKPQDEEEFDYLSYANDRAMFVWGDALRMGVVKAEELPEELRSRVKMVEY
jgi:choline kinase